MAKRMQPIESGGHEPERSSVTDNPFAEWLIGALSVSGSEEYQHLRLNEDVELRPEILESLTHYVERAHEDARRHLQQLGRTSLDPLGETDGPDWAAGYPNLLHIDTLKGYLGEVLAGIVCEYFGPLGITQWRVPAYLFRFHNAAIHKIIEIHQTGEQATEIPGRLGNDCLAFLRDEQGNIACILFCEAKCTSDHRSDMIRQAHEQISDKTRVPVSLPEVIEVLKNRGDPEARGWVKALQSVYFCEDQAACERYDLVSYACGRSPIRRESWLPTDGPHKSYTGNRRLQVVEIHLSDVEGLIREVYGDDRT